MADEIRENLDEEIEHRLSELSMHLPDEAGYDEKVDTVVKLYKLRIEEKLADNDILKSNEELRIKDGQLKESKIEKWLRFGGEILAVVSPLIFYGIWMVRGLAYEKTGSYTSQTFRGLIGKFRPTK